jgi:hypothetical protein
MTWRDGGREARSDPDDAGEGPNRGEIAVYFPFVGEGCIGALAAPAPPRSNLRSCVRAWSLLLRPFPGGRLGWPPRRGQASGWDGTGALGLA